MKWMRNIRACMFTVMLTVTVSNAVANGPAEIVTSNVEDVVAAIKQSKDKRSLFEIADKKVAPNFDFSAMTRTAVGRAWRDATPEQQQQLEVAFRGILVQTYTTALGSFKVGDLVVDVRPVSVKAGQDEVTVKSVAKQSGKQPVSIDYRMVRSTSGWKVVDVVIENLSLVTNYRDSFASEISRGGIDGLVQTLQAKHKALTAP